jgi:hypothetical protein
VPLLAHFFIAFLALVSGFTHAADTCYQWRIYGGAAAGVYPSADAACAAAFATGQTNGYQNRTTVAASGASATCERFQTAIPGQGWSSYESVYREAGTDCEPVCKAGPKKRINVTIGYHATPSQNIRLNPLVKTDPFIKQLLSQGKADMCKDGCKSLVDAPTGDKSWVSQVAGPNGMYRSSVDTTYTPSDQPCSTASPDAVSSSATPPACTGVTGTSASGATICIPSEIDDDNLGLSGGEATRGNPTAGDIPANQTDRDRARGPGGSGNGSGTGNASNGGGASGGPATGRNNTPGGRGCNDGTKSPTPPCSGSGEIDADGNTDKPPDGEEQQACGAPGQPKCRIDETGTPDGKGVFDKAKSDMDAEWDKKKTELDKFMNGSDKDTSWGVMPSWLHTGGCSPWSLGTLPVINVQINVDICPIKNVVDAVMSFIWAVGTFFAVTSLVFRTTTQSGS